MKRAVLTFAVALFAAITATAQVRILEVFTVEESDTMRCGIFREADAAELEAILTELQELDQKRHSTQTNAELRQMQSESANEEFNKELERVKKNRDEALKQLEAALSGEQLAKAKKQLTETFDKMMEEMPKQYAQMQQEMKQLESETTVYDASEFSNDKFYALKKRLKALAVGGRLYNYTNMRDFRHGLAAVQRTTEVKRSDGSTRKINRWGFVDETGRVVIPIIYSRVFDFNNRKYYRSGGIFEVLDDTDERGWTTVWNEQGQMGMIDRTGRTVIPHKFMSNHSYTSIRFYQTPWGEFAQVCEKATELYGIIDRSGNYTLKPSKKKPIIWYTDIECFGYRTADGQLVTFDPYGKEVKK